LLGAGVMGFDKALITNKDVKVEDWQERGYGVNVWVVNQQELKDQLVSNGRVAVTTDILFNTISTQ